MIFSTTTKNTLGSLVYISLDELFFFTLGLTYIIHKRRQLEQFKIICMIMNGLTLSNNHITIVRRLACYQWLYIRSRSRIRSTSSCKEGGCNWNRNSSILPLPTSGKHPRSSKWGLKLEKITWSTKTTVNCAMQDPNAVTLW